MTASFRRGSIFARAERDTRDDPLDEDRESVVVCLESLNQAVDRGPVGVLDRAPQGIGEHPFAGVADEWLAVLRDQDRPQLGGARDLFAAGERGGRINGPILAACPPFSQWAEVFKRQAERVD